MTHSINTKQQNKKILNSNHVMVNNGYLIKELKKIPLSFCLLLNVIFAKKHLCNVSHFLLNFSLNLMLNYFYNTSLLKKNTTKSSYI